MNVFSILGFVIFSLDAFAAIKCTPYQTTRITGSSMYAGRCTQTEQTCTGCGQNWTCTAGHSIFSYPGEGNCKDHWNKDPRAAGSRGAAGVLTGSNSRPASDSRGTSGSPQDSKGKIPGRPINASGN